MMTGDRIKKTRAEKGLTQGQLAKICGLAQSTIADLERNRNTGSSKIALIAKALGVNAVWLSEGKGDKYETGIPSKINIKIKESNSIHIPLLAATASMGEGVEVNENDLVVDDISITHNWINKNVPGISNFQNLRFIHAIGDSMHPTFNDGDILLVDIGAINAKSIDGVYVLSAQERLFVKRVRTRIDGQTEISSDNPSVKTVDILNGDHQVEIKGRVIWAWNGKKL